MADAAKGVRQLVLVHGRSAARQMVEPQDKSLVEIASEVLGDDSNRKGFSYSGLCLTSLPHRRLANEEPWERTVGPLTLIVEPGRIKLGDGPAKMMGVPYGARARLILIYLQTQAVLTNSREVSLGRSMREWMGRMGISVGGETAAALKEQARRIATCTMRFTWQAEGKAGAQNVGPTMISNERIIKSGLFFHDAAKGDTQQESLFEDRVLLDNDFFEQLRRHPVPLRDAAIQRLKDSSTALEFMSGWRSGCTISSATPRSAGKTSTSSSAPAISTCGAGSPAFSMPWRRPSRPTLRRGWTSRTATLSYTPARRPSRSSPQAEPAPAHGSSGPHGGQGVGFRLVPQSCQSATSRPFLTPEWLACGQVPSRRLSHSDLPKPHAGRDT